MQLSDIYRKNAKQKDFQACILQLRWLKQPLSFYSVYMHIISMPKQLIPVYDFGFAMHSMYSSSLDECMSIFTHSKASTHYTRTYSSHQTISNTCLVLQYTP